MASSISTLNASSSSTRPGHNQHGLGAWKSAKGEQLRAGIPHGHWKTTFVAGLRLTGMVAPLVLDGPINGTVFQTYADQFLVQTLALSCLSSLAQSPRCVLAASGDDHGEVYPV